MRFFLTAVFLTLTFTPAFTARAESRVVGDTFRSQREQHLKDIQQTQDQFKEQGGVMMKEREDAAAKVDDDRRDHQGKIDAAIAGWDKDAEAEGKIRADARAAIDKDREDHQAQIAPKSDQWWNDKDSLNQ